MNLQEACPNQGDKTCSISCQDPSQSNQCITLQAAVVDGSPCGYGGTCLGGNCQSGNLLVMAKAWFTSNLSISIPVTIAAGVVLLLLLYSLFVAGKRCCCGTRSSRWEPTLVQVDPVPESKPPTWEPSPPLALPPALRAGSSASLRQAPSVVRTRNGALASQDSWARSNSPAPSVPSRTASSSSRGSGRSLTQPNSQTRWVDAKKWNGPSTGY